jgi:hypothetical protein
MLLGRLLLVDVSGRLSKSIIGVVAAVISFFGLRILLVCIVELPRFNLLSSYFEITGSVMWYWLL